MTPLTIRDEQEGRVPGLVTMVPPRNEIQHYDVQTSVNLSTFGFADNFDASFPFLLPFYVDNNVKTILAVGLTLYFSKFRGYTVPAAHTHDVTIGNHTHSVTVGNHTHSVTVGNHTHDVIIPIAGGADAVADSVVYYSGLSSPRVLRIVGANPDDLDAVTSSSGGGTTVTSASGGGTTVTSSSGGGTTVTSSTASGASFGIFEDTYPATVHLLVNGVDRSTVLGGPWNPNAGSYIFKNLDLTPFVTESGLQTLELQTSQRGRVLPLLWVKSIIG